MREGAEDLGSPLRFGKVDYFEIAQGREEKACV